MPSLFDNISDEITDKECLEDSKRLDDEFDNNDTIDTGIRAIDIAYLSDKRAEQLLEAFNKAIAYIKEHTDLTEEQIKDIVNQNVLRIYIENYPDNPTGVGYVDGYLCCLGVNEDLLKDSPEKIYEFIKHEMTHMIGKRFVKEFLQKQLLVSGYTREKAFELEDNVEENTYFNEAAVEMFVSQDNPYREEKVFDYTINTNQDLNGGYYCLNSNLIHQMLLAKGIVDKEFHKGLYDYKTSKKVIKRFNNHMPKGIFNKLSKNMDNISGNVKEYYDLDYKIYEAEKNGDDSVDTKAIEGQMTERKQALEETIRKSERMIVDKILLPRLKKLPSIEQQQLLSEYDRFIISEREYFQLRTGYKAVAISKEQASPWLERVDIEPLDIESLSRDNIQYEKNNDSMEQKEEGDELAGA